MTVTLGRGTAFFPNIAAAQKLALRCRLLSVQCPSLAAIGTMDRQAGSAVTGASNERAEGMELRANWKLKQHDRYLDAIRRIQSAGITVNGCFILGLDGQTTEVFDQVLEFVRQSGLYEVQITLQTPFPGTPLYDRLQREGRLFQDRFWEKCTLFDLTHEPQGMTAQELRNGLIQVSQSLYSQAATRERRGRFFRNVN